MLRLKYAGRQSSLTLYQSNSGRKSPVSTTKLPALNGIPESIPILTEYEFQASSNSKRPPKILQSSVCAPPISDMCLPMASLLRLDSFRDMSPIVIDEMPPLPMVDSRSFPAIFAKKIEACNRICTFANEQAEKLSIDRKASFLTEIHRLFIGASPQSNRLSDDQFKTIYDMCMKNIVRRLPNLGAVAYVNEDVGPLVEPAWTHLSIVYQILMKVLFDFPEAPFFTFKTITRLLRVSASGDSRERFQISLFISRYVDFRQELLESTIEKFSSMIQSYIDDLISPFSVSTILNAFFAILKDSNDMKIIFIKFFKRYIVPLLADNYFSFFEQSLISIINFFVEDDQRNSTCIVSTILKKWPYTRLSKQTTFLSILMRCLPKMPQRELIPRIPRVFALLAQATDSECFKVAETAFSMWTTIGFERIINDNIKLVLQVFIPHVANAIHNHWCASVRSNANFAIAVMKKRDPKLVQSYLQGESIPESDNPSLKQWVSIARVAAKYDTILNLSKKLNEISSVYSIPLIAKTGLITHNHPGRPRANSFRNPQPIIRPNIQIQHIV